MDDIEKLFKEKLAQHPVAPPPGVWEKLQQTQVQEKKIGAWWWMAASIALLLLAGAAFIFTQQPPTTNDKVAIVLPKIQSKIPKLASEDMPKPLLKHTPETVAAIPQAEVLSPTATVSQVPASEKSQTRATQRLVSIDKIETTSPQEYQPKVNPLRPAARIADVSVQPKTAVTIIYKSGKVDNEAIEEPNRPLKKALTFFADIKEGGVGFSELRSAKSEIISKAFSSKREPMAAE
ncbi:MAG: hypothetical protein WBA23_19200 [Tunicatimonas sp.]|uniref:hypothetical protein n=1 Tax=Tunicatimonas sp. TaxID=1940096 RepID=UPI003C76A399